MAAGTALKKITARVKVLRKKHPKAKYKSLQQQAGKEFKAGKLKTKKVSGVKRKAAPKRKAVRRKAARKRATKVRVITRTIAVGTVRRKRRKAAPKRKAARRRRIGNSGSNMLPIILGVGALGLLAYMALKPSQTTAQLAYQPTGSYDRDNKASEILAWATAAGLGISAITNLINALNTGSDAKVTAIYNQAKEDPNNPSWMTAISGYNVRNPYYSDN